MWAGLRAGEVRALRKSDINVQTRRITVRRSRCCGIETTTKGEDERTVAITSRLWERLEPRLAEIKTPDGHVCISSEHQPWGDYGVYYAFVRACRRLCIAGSRFHSCRHYFATAMFGFGASPITVKESLGHKRLETTMRYSHFQQADQDRAIEKFSIPKPMAAK